MKSINKFIHLKFHLNSVISCEPLQSMCTMTINFSSFLEFRNHQNSHKGNVVSWTKWFISIWVFSNLLHLFWIVHVLLSILSKFPTVKSYIIITLNNAIIQKYDAFTCTSQLRVTFSGTRATWQSSGGMRRHTRQQYIRSVIVVYSIDL